MGTDNRREHDNGRRISNPLLFLISCIVVGVNVVVLYAFSLQPCSCETQTQVHKVAEDRSRIDIGDEILKRYELQISDLKAELRTLHQGTERVILERTQAIYDELTTRPASCGKGDGDGQVPRDSPFLEWSVGERNREFEYLVEPKKLPLGKSLTLFKDTIISPVGHGCAMMKADIDQYMSYKVGEECPDDEFLTQRLLVGGCEPLPRRRCFTRIPNNYKEPLPLPDSLWNASADGGVIWTAHTCKNFTCLKNRANQKVFADCLDCFDLEGKEKNRWLRAGTAVDFTIDEVLSYKNGTIRIGLDLGGGTASFAVRMKERGVTIVTTTLNLNGPFNNFVAIRGVVPLYMTVSQRLPFFDNTLDIVHSMHVLSNWIPNDTLEFIFYDIDRILRPGGLFWLDRFFCVKSQLTTYLPMLENLKYTKLRWEIGDKLDRGPEMQEAYISAVLMKPTERDARLSNLISGVLVLMVDYSYGPFLEGRRRRH
ncbi:hypothetical protein R1sor_001108 [Riccia sorocarpa]|uniref:Methyltransferase type 11 domain-containing protein n=1 Tax=Riccia sorocarpa TaxID=122646 RepID=A0ABD3GX00_9MARC